MSRAQQSGGARALCRRPSKTAAQIRAAMAGSEGFEQLKAEEF